MQTHPNRSLCSAVSLRAGGLAPPTLVTVLLAGLAFGEESSTKTRVAIARVEGTIGFKGGVGAEPAFDSTTIERIVDQARRQRCKIVLLDLDSPGGYVHEGEKIIDIITQAQSDGITFIAWYGQAFSAASWIPLAAKHAISKPTGTCGGSVVLTTQPDGKRTALDAKYISATIGKVRNAAAAGDKPMALVDPMFLIESELWITKDGTLHASDPGDGSRCVDGATTILNMDAKLACEVKLATGIASSRDAAATCAGIGKVQWIDLSSVVRERVKAIAKSEEQFDTSAKTWLGLMPELIRLIDRAVVDSKTSADYHAAGKPGMRTDLKMMGSRARQRLRDYYNKKLKPAMAPAEYDPGLLVDTKQRTAVYDFQRQVMDRVARIMDLLDSRSNVAITEAASQRDDLFAFVNPDEDRRAAEDNRD
jgi:hypothetical protein